MAEKYFSGEGVSQNIHKAVEYTMMSARNGHAEAQGALAFMYYHGQGVNKDYKKAYEWCEKAASNDFVGVYHLLGAMYYRGEGVRQDYQKAFEWLEKSAHQGYAAAQCALGTMYFEGQGIQQDFKKAFEWFEKSAQQGHADSQYLLGLLYKTGKGVQQNSQKALEWLEKAVQQGHAEAKKAYEEVNGLMVMEFLGSALQGVDKKNTSRKSKSANEGFGKASQSHRMSTGQEYRKSAQIVRSESSDSAIGIVKNGIFEFDKSTTIGNAFDNYSYFTSTSWKKFETRQKKVIVEFEGHLDLTAFFSDYDVFREIMIEKIESELHNKQFDENKVGKEQLMSFFSDSMNLTKYGRKYIEYFMMQGGVANGLGAALEAFSGIENGDVYRKMCDKLKKDEIRNTNTSIIIQFAINVDDTFDISYVGVRFDNKEYEWEIDDLVNIYDDMPMELIGASAVYKLYF